MSHTGVKIAGPPHSLCSQKQHGQGNEANIMQSDALMKLMFSIRVSFRDWGVGVAFAPPWIFPSPFPPSSTHYSPCAPTPQRMVFIPLSRAGQGCPWQLLVCEGRTFHWQPEGTHRGEVWWTGGNRDGLHQDPGHLWGCKGVHGYVRLLSTRKNPFVACCETLLGPTPFASLHPTDVICIMNAPRPSYSSTPTLHPPGIIHMRNVS